MTTGVCFITVFSDHILALWPQAYIVKYIALLILFFLPLIQKFITAEAALLSVLKMSKLVTVFACVIWRDTTSMAKDLFALSASHPKLTHMDGS